MPIPDSFRQLLLQTKIWPDVLALEAALEVASASFPDEELPSDSLSECVRILVDLGLVFFEGPEGRAFSVPAALDGLTFSHRVSIPEAESGWLRVCPDFSPLLPLRNFDESILCAGYPLFFSDDTFLCFPPGLPGLVAGEIVNIRMGFDEDGTLVEVSSAAQAETTSVQGAPSSSSSSGRHALSALSNVSPPSPAAIAAIWSEEEQGHIYEIVSDLFSRALEQGDLLLADQVGSVLLCRGFFDCTAGIPLTNLYCTAGLEITGRLLGPRDAVAETAIEQKERLSRDIGPGASEALSLFEDGEALAALPDEELAVLFAKPGALYTFTTATPYGRAVTANLAARLPAVHPGGLLARAHLARIEGQLDEEQDCARKALTVAPECGAVARFAAEIANDRGDADESLRLYALDPISWQDTSLLEKYLVPDGARAQAGTEQGDETPATAFSLWERVPWVVEKIRRALESDIRWDAHVAEAYQVLDDLGVEVDSLLNLSGTAVEDVALFTSAADGTCPIDWVIARRGPLYPADEQNMIAGWAAAGIDVWEVEEVESSVLEQTNKVAYEAGLQDRKKHEKDPKKGAQAKRKKEKSPACVLVLRSLRDAHLLCPAESPFPFVFRRGTLILSVLAPVGDKSAVLPPALSVSRSVLSTVHEVIEDEGDPLDLLAALFAETSPEIAPFLPADLEGENLVFWRAEVRVTDPDAAFSALFRSHLFVTEDGLLFRRRGDETEHWIAEKVRLMGTLVELEAASRPRAAWLREHVLDCLQDEAGVLSVKEWEETVDDLLGVAFPTDPEDLPPVP